MLCQTQRQHADLALDLLWLPAEAKLFGRLRFLGARGLLSSDRQWFWGLVNERRQQS